MTGHDHGFCDCKTLDTLSDQMLQAAHILTAANCRLHPEYSNSDRNRITWTVDGVRAWGHQWKRDHQEELLLHERLTADIKAAGSPLPINVAKHLLSAGWTRPDGP